MLCCEAVGIVANIVSEAHHGPPATAQTCQTTTRAIGETPFRAPELWGTVMNVDTAVLPERPHQEEQPSDAKPKTQPPYAVIVFNDDQHSFPYVIETFMKVFGYELEKSRSLAVEIHNQGKGVVWSGSREVAELKRDQIRSAGPDFYAAQKVDFPCA